MGFGSGHPNRRFSLGDPMFELSRTTCPTSAAILAIAGLLLGGIATAAEPVRLLIEPLTVPPATQPLISVVVQNLQDQPCRATLSLAGPDDWRIAPASREAELPASGEQRLTFNIEKARNLEANAYPLTVAARVGDQLVQGTQEVFVASAPYFKATVDGRADEWKDAIPVAFRHAGKHATISTYWSRKRFYILVSVQEEQHVGYTGLDGKPCDAVQLAVSSVDTAEDAAGTARRVEFLLTSTRGAAQCFQLAAWDTPLEAVNEARPLEPLACSDVEVAILRKGDVTNYECSIPFSMLREAVEPAEGREFFLSVLIHDPNGTGLRDLGRTAGLWPRADDATAWSRWTGATWEGESPLGNKVRWGLCTSKY